VTVWLRGKKYKTKKKKGKRIHIEVRDPDLNLRLVKTYKGKDHTFHIILEEEGK
jgi:hypothetical protein